MQKRSQAKVEEAMVTLGRTDAIVAMECIQDVRDFFADRNPNQAERAEMEMLDDLIRFIAVQLDDIAASDGACKTDPNVVD